MDNSYQFTKDPFHGVSFGSKQPEIVNAIIEIPRGSQAKYEIDKESGLIKLDRILYGAVHYPANYGFIPRTYCDDKDPLDILVFCSVDVYPLTIMQGRVIGCMRMIDQGEQDDKIIAVSNDDANFKNVNSLNDLPPHVQEQVQRFFEDYKKIEKKEVKVEQFLDKEQAYQIIKESIQLYIEKFPHNQYQL